MEKPHEKGKLEYDPDAVALFVEENFEVLNEKGDEQITVCPFCQGGQSEEVSFSINIKKGVAACWRANHCNWQGSVVALIKDFYQLDWKEAYKVAGGVAPQDVDGVIGILDRKLSKLRPEHFNASGQLREPVSAFPTSAEHITQVDPEIMAEVCDWLYHTRGYDPDEFMEVHDLYICPEAYFDGRVLFKILTNEHEAYIAYAYRPDKIAEKKTVNPPGEVLSRMLYNYEDAKLGRYIFITEGIFDAARLIERELYATCIFGVNISLDQVFLLYSTKADEIVVCLDEGTEKASLKVAQTLRKYINNKRISIMQLDVEGSDPDNLSEPDFERCFSKRLVTKTDEDYADYLIKEFK